jgi:hypothetical protein
MSDLTFQLAYARVRTRYSETEWQTMSPHQVAGEIYREIRILDAARQRDRGTDEPNSGDRG